MLLTNDGDFYATLQHLDEVGYTVILVHSSQWAVKLRLLSVIEIPMDTLNSHKPFDVRRLKLERLQPLSTSPSTSTLTATTMATSTSSEEVPFSIGHAITMPGINSSMLVLAGSVLVLGTMSVQASENDLPSQVMHPGLFDDGSVKNPYCDSPSMASELMTYTIFVPRAKPMDIWAKIGDPFDLTWTSLNAVADIANDNREVKLCH
ncbi:hypothetical protein CXG81DRAFT_25392 [Caulochytrium protostelioides]|uniref:NYN domain-containing protein n=1 Tax=Caulochytrium protostelioides TaxID=1555241 RepID=A0A4P9X9Y5_9FUNG|nr:hypothetical protein CXG81DRAFT_25392 [Caulochytrium protostelioides]|eukprot:RKP01900.1 hypothetical protein CXG81DRAFT_25392 [Caulochytrium protostelioides]